MIFPIIINILYILLNIYGGIMIISIFMSWIPSAYDYKFPRLVLRISDWYLSMFRGKIIFSSLDFTPIIGLAIYNYIVNLLTIWM